MSVFVVGGDFAGKDLFRLRIGFFGGLTRREVFFIGFVVNINDAVDFNANRIGTIFALTEFGATDFDAAAHIASTRTGAGHPARGAASAGHTASASSAAHAAGRTAIPRRAATAVAPSRSASAADAAGTGARTAHHTHAAAHHTHAAHAAHAARVGTGRFNGHRKGDVVVGANAHVLHVDRHGAIGATHEDFGDATLIDGKLEADRHTVKFRKRRFVVRHKRSAFVVDITTEQDLCQRLFFRRAAEGEFGTARHSHAAAHHRGG